MDKKYISPNGLRQVWGKINEVFAKKTELPDVTGIQWDLEEHVDNRTIHVTAEDKSRWDASAGGDLGKEVAEHIGNSDIHVTAELKNEWSGKQNRITDLDAIRSGAAKGATAIQSHQSLDAYATKTMLNDYATRTSLNDYATKRYVDDTYSNINAMTDTEVGEIIGE